MTQDRAPLKHLGPGWYTLVMGLAGLSLAWHAAVPVLGDGAGAGGVVIGALALVIGLATYGYNVTRAVGVKMSKLSPSRGFSAELATAL